MLQIEKDVRAFHEGCDIPIREIPHIPQERKGLRWDLCEEEADELFKAIREDDLTEIADACCDLVYVIVGLCLEYGIPFSQCWEEVQRSNMQKLTGPKREDGKQLKPEGWEPPKIAEIITAAQNK